jgi:hypothetical protein
MEDKLNTFIDDYTTAFRICEDQNTPLELKQCVLGSFLKEVESFISQPNHNKNSLRIALFAHNQITQKLDELRAQNG